MTHEEFNSMRGVTNNARVDSSLYTSSSAGKGSKAAAAAAAAAVAAANEVDSLLPSQSTSAGDGEAKKLPKSGSDTMYYRVTCKVCMASR
jgi:hypothetical protein